MKRSTKSFGNRILSLALAMTMVLGMIPSSLAANPVGRIDFYWSGAVQSSISLDEGVTTVSIDLLAYDDSGTRLTEGTWSSSASGSDVSISGASSSTVILSVGDLTSETSTTLTSVWTDSDDASNTMTNTISVTFKPSTSNEDSNEDTETAPAIVTGISLTSSSGTPILDVSKQMYLTAIVTMSDGTTGQSAWPELVWELDNNCVNISGQGSSSSNTVTITAASPGETTITVTHPDWSGEAKFTVTVTGITIVGATDLKLSTNDEEVITVNRYGNASTVSVVSTDSTLLSISDVESSYTASTSTFSIYSNVNTGDATVQISPNTGDMITLNVTVEESIASHIIPIDNVNTLSPLKFSSIEQDFSDRAKELFGEEIDYISNVQVPTVQGTLYLGYTNENSTGAGVASTRSYSFTKSPMAQDIVFVPKESYDGTVAIIEYTGMTVGGNPFFGEIHATIAPIDSVGGNTTAKEPIGFSSYDFSQVASNSGKVVDYIVFAIPDENKAVMYYDYTSSTNYHHIIKGGEEIDLDDIDKITVIPTGGFSGDLTIPYIITATDGSTISGESIITVEGYGAEGPVVYTTVMGNGVRLDSDDFHTNAVAVTGFAMSYVTFSLPSASEGTLYLNYLSSGNYGGTVNTSSAYYASAKEPSIDSVTFVPTAGYTGSVEIDFIGYDIMGTSYKGTLEINVNTQSVADINYACYAYSFVPFYGGDFNQYSLNQTGAGVDFITFPSLPTITQGSVRLGQTSFQPGVTIEENVRYYYDESPSLSNLSFQAATNYSGLVSIPFVGKSTNGDDFSGTVIINVSNQALVKVPYTATQYNPARFQSADFDLYSVQRTGTNLDYVRFELPDNSIGTLYYDYVAPDNMGTAVNSYTNYYMNANQFLSSVSFVPEKSFQGTANISFTAWGTNGNSFTGTVSIYVADNGDPLTYSIYSGDTVYLDTSSFNDYCVSETGAALNYITIENPSISQGRLYKEYDPNSTAHSASTDSTRYYKSQAPYISGVAFVASEDYVGVVQLDFTAHATDGSSCEGTLTILVRSSSASDNVYYYSSFSPVQFNEADVYAVWAAEDIAYIEIHNTPEEEQGKLYYENNLNSFATTTLRYYSSNNGQGPYISDMVYAPRAGFDGTMSVSYTATTISNRTFSGEICVVVSTGQDSIYFNDMGGYPWATSAVDYLYLTSVTRGVSESHFNPSANISRGDFALMICNAFRFTNTVPKTTFSDVPNNSYYYEAANTLKALLIAEGDGRNFKPEENISRQDALLMLSNAMAYAGKELKIADTSILDNYNDGWKVSSYARAGLANMVETGIISGSYGNLNPTAAISRAEMAVVIHQAMTC
ncbi:MAG: S-layer homology domain-containing protein [Eubacteriales bacterium]